MLNSEDRYDAEAGELGEETHNDDDPTCPACGELVRLKGCDVCAMVVD